MMNMNSFGSATKKVRRGQFSLVNRLRSIDVDAQYVGEFMSSHPNLECFANLRQGIWYTQRDSATCYFKSTDGHPGAWKFNLSRLNLHVVRVAIDSNGAVLVDSTRKGKRFPDSFMRTVPIWTCVMNRAKARLFPEPQWDSTLYLHPSIGDSERAQIEKLIPEFVDAVCGSLADLSCLRWLVRPLRAVWVDRYSAQWTADQHDRFARDYIPIICLSCGRIEDDVVMNHRQGWHYIQGAADDQENWAQGLTHSLFHSCRDRFLMAQTDVECQEIIKNFQTQFSPQHYALCESYPLRETNISIELFEGKFFAEKRKNYSVVCFANGKNAQAFQFLLPNVLQVNIPDCSKNGLHKSLAAVIGFYESAITSCDSSAVFSIISPTKLGANLSACIAIAILSVFYRIDSATGAVLFATPSGFSHISKSLLRRWLQFIQRYIRDCYPSRSFMQQLNRFFLSPS